MSHAASSAPPKSIIIYGHSPLFYWWPVWLVGFIMGFYTLYEDSRVAIVPAGSQYYAPEPGKPARIELPEGKEIADERIKESGELYERMATNKNLGIIYAVAVLVVILITNVPMRGLTSAIVIAVILLITVTFAYLGWWSIIFDWLFRLNIHMNAGFYLFFSTVLFVVWVFAFRIYDRFSYWEIKPGEITHGYILGGGERSFQTEGMTFEKQRDDLFRHWILGFGSGDLTMTPLQMGKGKPEDFSIHNVMFVGSKLRQIQTLISVRPERPD
ncbi:MAG: hypothetical protein NZM31_03760 [Gemmatales bacterium]|nr:hypothetical protein [Gemmatales bacterium]MDW8386116.1 hypothetical protein [Gemmatales bacterium]